MLEDLLELAPAERCQRYRELAAAADLFASIATGREKEAYLFMAEQWRKLADETAPVPVEDDRTIAL